MARGGWLPRAGGRPPRFLRTGHRCAIGLSEAHLRAARRDARHTLEGDAEVPSGIAGVRTQEATFRVLADGDPNVDAALASRGGLLAAAEVADAAPATALRPKGAMLRAAAALPRLSGRGSRLRRCVRGDRGCFARRAAVCSRLPPGRQSGTSLARRVLISPRRAVVSWR
jgi:hypothetical protein